MKSLAHNYLLLCSYYYLIFTTVLGVNFILIHIDPDPLATGLLMLLVFIPIALFTNVFGPAVFLYILFTGKIEPLKYYIILPIIISLAIILSLKAIKLLKKEDYSKSFLKFWYFMSFLVFSVFLVELSLYFSPKFDVYFILIFPSLINSILIFIFSRYLYRQQKNSGPISSNSNTKVN